MNAIETLESLSANGLFTEAQARALVRALEGAGDDAATKDELDATADVIRSEVRAVESRLEAKIEAVRSDLLKWGMGLMLSTVGPVLAGTYFLLAHFKP